MHPFCHHSGDTLLGQWRVPLIIMAELFWAAPCDLESQCAAKSRLGHAGQDGVHPVADEGALWVTAFDKEQAPT